MTCTPASRPFLDGAESAALACSELIAPGSVEPIVVGTGLPGSVISSSFDVGSVRFGMYRRGGGVQLTREGNPADREYGIPERATSEARRDVSGLASSGLVRLLAVPFKFPPLCSQSGAVYHCERPCHRASAGNRRHDKRVYRYSARTEWAQQRCRQGYVHNRISKGQVLDEKAVGF